MMVPLTGEVCSSSTIDAAAALSFEDGEDLLEEEEEGKDIFGLLRAMSLLLLLSSSRLRLKMFGDVCGGKGSGGLAWFSAAMAANPLARLLPCCWWSCGKEGARWVSQFLT